MLRGYYLDKRKVAFLKTPVNVVQTKLFVVRTKKGEVVDLNLIGESLFEGARPR